MKKIIVLILIIIYPFKNKLVSNMKDGKLKEFILGLPDFKVKKTLDSSPLDASVVDIETNVIPKPDYSQRDMSIFDSGATPEFSRNNPHLVYEDDSKDSGFAIKYSGRDNMKSSTANMYFDFAENTYVSHTINSAFREIEYNKLVGGSPKSDHIVGGAVDLGIVPDEQEIAVMELLSSGFRRIGVYSWGVHAGDNPVKSNLLWCKEDSLSRVLSWDIWLGIYDSVFVYMNDGTTKTVQIQPHTV